MKNKKIFTVVLLLAVSALLFTSCAFKMNTKQKILYENFIAKLKIDSGLIAIPADMVTGRLAAVNVEANELNFKIVDNQPGSAIAKDTSAAELRKRFIPKKK
ncbi:hypothetical protein [Treponema denticola]|uniref:hypothetical protein n=1 Tax=Treponema denticola TaxID=158 RepID=UPI0020A553E7|nr:hypothetical protein [Treponema denticola]UTC83930.1 hypothetical protein HGJ18_12310 [Treponema denticola]